MCRQPSLNEIQLPRELDGPFLPSPLQNELTRLPRAQNDGHQTRQNEQQQQEKTSAVPWI